MNTSLRFLGLAAIAAAIAPAAGAQTLERRVAGAADGPVQFHFAARDGVCGNGRNFMRAEDGGYYMSYNNDGNGRDACAVGPVRVVVARAGKEIVKIETYAGPLANDPEGGADLGAVSTREAAAYLLGLAGTLEGRPARDAMLPAMLADSTQVTSTLLALAKDQSRPRDVRRSAISWLSRRREESGGVGAAGVARALDQLVRDRNENESIRTAALTTVSGLDRGEGIPTLVTYAGDADSWLAKQAFSSLARSGDPRARQFVRAAIKRTDLTEESRVTAIQGIGGEQATGSDIRLLRDLYPSLNSDRERDAVLSSVANAGGNDNATWLLAIAKSPTEPANRRKRAVSLLSRSDDPRVKDALKELIER
ncbi:MAG: UPF0147 family protein [Gemmatimonadota bacterium]